MWSSSRLAWLSGILALSAACGSDGGGAGGRSAVTAGAGGGGGADGGVDTSKSCGHAHNDYAHAVPLHDALDRGFCSVEADIFLVCGDLLVGHNQAALDPARTLESLYLDPLRALAGQ